MQAKTYYFEGKHRTVIEEKTTQRSAAFKIGSLVFLGRHTEARLLYDNFKSKMTFEEKAMTHFHLAVSYTRTSDYKIAKGFVEKSQAKSKKLSPLSEFYQNQGLAFYEFFFSQHKNSQHQSLLAHRALLKLKTPPPFLLWMSLDIQGHNHIQLGEIHLGLKLFQEAQRVAKKSDLKSLFDESRLSYEFYKAEFASDVVSSIARLTRLFDQTAVENDYSKSQVMLQIAKLLLLKGDYKSAQDFLSAHFNLAYQNENKRKLANMNTLLARLLFVRGQFIEALGLIKVARSYLSSEIDKSLLLPILGLESRILIAMNQDDSAPRLQSIEISKTLDNFLRQRIQQRRMGHFPHLNHGQDELGDLMDEAARHLNSEALQKIIDHQLFGILPEVLGLKTYQPAIVITELKDVVVIVDSDKIQIVDERLTKKLHKVLSLLGQGPQSKQALIEKIWGYDYHPLRHDPVVYSTFVRLRKILGQKSFWIQNDEQFYYLYPGVQLVDRTFHQSPAPITAVLSSPTPELTQLNFRQIESLESINNFIGVTEYAKKWKVTKMTALRDLKGLANLGYMQVSGKGRATRYTRTRG